MWVGAEGWGVVDSEATPGGCWVHFSAVRGRSQDDPAVGEHVVVDCELAAQDGYSYRAVALWRSRDRFRSAPSDAATEISEGGGDAYHSELTIKFPAGVSSEKVFTLADGRVVRSRLSPTTGEREWVADQ
jgi:CspA family cold shock protein